MNETKIDDVGVHLKEYVKIQYDLIELQLIEKTAVSGAALISSFVVSLVLFISVIFLSVGLAFYLSQLLNNSLLSFVLVGILYLLITVLFIIFKKQWLILPLRNKIIKVLTNKDSL